MNEENTVRKILKNEITWIIMLVGGIMAFVSQVIIPINSIQAQLSMINEQIAEIKSYDNRITNNANNIIVLQQQVAQIERIK